MIVKITQDLRKRIQAQIKKLQEIFNKEIEELKGKKKKDEQCNMNDKYTRRNQ